MSNQQKDLSEIAEKVINKMPQKSEENFGFVITVLMVISIILTLVRVIQECNKTKTDNFNQQEMCAFFGEQTKTLSIKRGWFTKMTIKKILRKQLSKDNYKTYGYDLMNAILDTGAELNEKEIKTLVETLNV
jgi:hypothetical protein